MKRRDVRYWHLADIAAQPPMSAIGGKADIARPGPPCRAIDPERTSAVISCCNSEALAPINVIV